MPAITAAIRNTISWPPAAKNEDPFVLADNCGEGDPERLPPSARADQRGDRGLVAIHAPGT